MAITIRCIDKLRGALDLIKNSHEHLNTDTSAISYAVLRHDLNEKTIDRQDRLINELHEKLYVEKEKIKCLAIGLRGIMEVSEDA